MNELVVKRPAATYFVRATGDSMIGAGIAPGDILVVDRSLEASSNKVVIAVVNGDLTVKRFIAKGGKVLLAAENEHYKTIEISENDSFEVWGVVTCVLKFYGYPFMSLNNIIFQFRLVPFKNNVK